jgi:hypothetical protein
VLETAIAIRTVICLPRTRRRGNDITGPNMVSRNIMTSLGHISPTECADVQCHAVTALTSIFAMAAATRPGQCRANSRTGQNTMIAGIEARTLSRETSRIGFGHQRGLRLISPSSLVSDHLAVVRQRAGPHQFNVASEFRHGAQAACKLLAQRIARGRRLGFQRHRIGLALARDDEA